MKVVLPKERGKSVSPLYVSTGEAETAYGISSGRQCEAAALFFNGKPEKSAALPVWQLSTMQ